MKRKLIVAYVVIAVAVAWPVSAGLFFHDQQAIFLEHYDGVHEFEWARKHRRRDLGFAVGMGALYAAIWPLALPAALCITGFAEHGVFEQR